MSRDEGYGLETKQPAVQAWFEVGVGLVRSESWLGPKWYRRGSERLPTRGPWEIHGGGWLAQRLLQIPCMASHRKPIGAVPLHMKSPMLSPRRERMSMPTIFCMQCKTLRAVNDWREQGDAFVIELDPCGHVAVRTARLEWVARSAAA